MNIEGTYTLQSKLTEIQQSLTQPEVLRRTIPGLEHLEPVEQNRYTVAIHIKYHPLVGTYRGQVSIDENSASYRLVLESDGNSNILNGIANIQLHEQGDNTTIHYKGTLSIGKRGTRLTPIVTKGAVKLLIQQFFTSLSDQLRKDKIVQREEGAVRITDSLGVLAEPGTLGNEASVAYKIVRFLGLGGGEVVQEKVWTQRVRRIGLIATFLLLVWVGTRLPRKK